MKASHMRMLLEALAHFHGAWLVWLQHTDTGLGEMSRHQMMEFFGQQKMYQWKSMWKMMMKKLMNYYVVMAEARNEPEMKDRVTAFINSPTSVDSFMKTFDYKDSKFRTMTHSDMWTSQIMFALNDDGIRTRIIVNSYIYLIQELQSE